MLLVNLLRGDIYCSHALSSLTSPLILHCMHLRDEFETEPFSFSSIPPSSFPFDTLLASLFPSHPRASARKLLFLSPMFSLFFSPQYNSLSFSQDTSWAVGSRSCTLISHARCPCWRLSPLTNSTKIPWGRDSASTTLRSPMPATPKLRQRLRYAGTFIISLLPLSFCSSHSSFCSSPSSFCFSTTKSTTSQTHKYVLHMHHKPT